MTDNGFGYFRPLLFALLTASTVAAAPSALAAPDSSCTAVLGSDWVDHDGQCDTTITSPRSATMTASAQLPLELLGNPVAGPPIRSYLRSLSGRWRATAVTMVRDSEFHLEQQSFSHSSLRSVVFHQYSMTDGSTPNNSYRTFTFDVARGRELALGDLFTPGVNPLTVLPPLVRPYLTDTLNRVPPPHDAGTYPFTSDKFEPQPDGSGYAGNYRAFALTPDELILYLPDTPMQHENPWPRDRFVWSMDGGTVQVHVPLSALGSILAV